MSRDSGSSQPPRTLSEFEARTSVLGTASDWAGGRPILAVLVCCAAIAALMLVQTRELFLDDTFIHLRIARNLAEHGVYSFNGAVPAYSTSSPLYTMLLATLWKMSPSLWVPKIVGVAAYAGLLAALVSQLGRARGSPQGGVYLLWIVALSSPMAIRWLTDGMETALVAVSSVALGRAVAMLRLDSGQRRISLLWLLCPLSAIATALRVESASLVALTVGAFAADAFWHGKRPQNSLVIGLAYMLFGSSLSLLAVRGYFGHLLPDTAIAKAGVGTAADAIINSFKAHLAASLFGIGTLAAWVASIWLAWRSRGNRIFIAAINAGMPLLLGLIAVRHQAVQGYRYFIFAEFFLLACNAGLLGHHLDPGTSSALWLRRMCRRPIALMALTATVIAWEGYDWHRLSVMSDGRSVTFENFHRQDFSDLRGKRGLAWDVGMIGYFSQATILDVNGLVNGREIASLPYAERLQRLSAMPVDFVFANAGQLRQLDGRMDDTRWNLLAEYQFPNFSGDPDTHYLFVRAASGSDRDTVSLPHPDF